MRTNQLIIALFQRFCWLDEGLQSRMRDLGWPGVSRRQSMVMTNIVSGVVRSSEIARNLGVSRQAIHSTIGQMVELGILRLDPDPQDRRHMVVSLTDTGAAMRRDAQRAMDELGSQLAERLGKESFDALLAALDADWGDNMNGKQERSRRRSAWPRSRLQSL